MKTIYTTGQVAKMCQVAPRTVSKWFDSGRLKGFRIAGPPHYTATACRVLEEKRDAHD